MKPPRWKALRARVVRLLPAVLLLPVGATPAHAHLVSTGLGPFYDGATHLLVTPENLLAVTATALIAGLRGPRSGRLVLGALPLAWLLGLAAGLLAAPALTPPPALPLLLVVLGALVALDRPLPGSVVAGIAVAVGLVYGGLDGAGMAGGPAALAGAAGVGCMLFVVVSLLAGHVASIRTPWARIAVRVAGSWIVAIGLFLLGWSFRPA